MPNENKKKGRLKEEGRVHGESLFSHWRALDPVVVVVVVVGTHTHTCVCVCVIVIVSQFHMHFSQLQAILSPSMATPA